MLKILSFFLFSSISFNVFAGVTMVSTETGMTPSPIQSRIYLDTVGMRAETPGSGNSVVIFRKDKSLLWIINNTDKTYVELDKNTLVGMTAKMNEAMKMMQEKMAKMPPEQRKMMEQVMQQNNIPLPNATQPKTVYTKTERRETVGAWQADVYEGVRNGVKVSEIWTIDPAASGIGTSDMAVIGDYVQFMKDFLKDMNLGAFTDFAAPGIVGNESYVGFPVKTIVFENGKNKGETMLTEIKKESIPAIQFALPEGYTKAQANPMGDLEM